MSEQAEYNEETLARLIQEGSAMFDASCQERHEAGAADYGTFGFLGNDTLRMAMEELVDLANYARYTFVKLWLLVNQLEDFHKQSGDIPIGPSAFISSQPKED